MRNLILMLTAFISWNAHALDCKGHLSNIEEKICDQQQLLGLDHELNSIYKIALKYVSNTSELKTAQQKWLIKRNLCSKADTGNYPCLFNIYSERINWLSSQILNSEKPLLPNQINYKDCQAIADIGDKHELDSLKVIQPDTVRTRGTSYSRPLSKTELEKLNKHYSLGFQPPYDQIEIKSDDSKYAHRFATISIGGTCPQEQIFNIDASLAGDEKGGWTEVNDSMHSIEWVHSGAADSVVRFDNQDYVITENIWNGNDLQMISLISNKGQIIPMCQVVEKQSALIVLKSEDDVVCNEIANGDKAAVKGRNVNIPKFNTRVQSNIENSDSTEVFKIDVNNDGKVETIGLFTFESTAGCGNTAQWLRELNNSENDIKKGDLNNQLTVLTDNIYIRHNLMLKIYKINNNSYMRLNANKSGKFSNNFFQVVKLEGNNPKIVCELERKSHSEIRKILSVPN